MNFREFIFPSYVRLSSASRNASRRTSDRGRLVQTGAIVCAALGIDTDLTLIYQLFALLISLIIVSRFSLRFTSSRLKVERILPKYATAGEGFQYQIRITNRGGEVEKDLMIVDNPKIFNPSYDQFKYEKEPHEETRNAYDRFIGFHRFIWLQKQYTGISVKPAHLDDVGIKASFDQTIEANPLRRGVVTFNSISLLKPDPFGLNYGITDVKQLDQLLVLPRRFKVSLPPVSKGGRHFQPGGVDATWSIGESDEFVSLRDFRDGDPLKKIHWASSAKRQKPVVKEYQDEYFVRQALILDTDTEDKLLFEEAVSVAASFAFHCNTPDSLVDLIYANETLKVITSGRGYAHTSQQLEALAVLECSMQSIDTLCKGLQSHAHLLSGAIMVLCNWDKSRRTMVSHLQSLKLDVQVFVLTRNETALKEGIHFVSCDGIEDYLASL